MIITPACLIRGLITKKHTFNLCFAIKCVKCLNIKTLKKSLRKTNMEKLQQPWTCEDINRPDFTSKHKRFLRGVEEGCKVLNSPAPSDVVILVAFLPGEDLINAEKQTRSVRWRGCCGVRTVAHWTHPPVGRKRSCGKKSKQEPWTGLFNPAVNPWPYLPTTSHYLCTTFSPHTTHT